MKNSGDGKNMQYPKVVTLSDIAECLGTTKNTVSRALRDCSDIGAEMKERVRKTAEEMGYQPNRIANFMRSRKSNLIAVVISSFNPFFSICTDYIFDYLAKEGYHALIILKKEGKILIEDIIRCLQSGACGIFSFIDLDKTAAGYCNQNEIPLLICGLHPQEKSISAVYFDDRLCGEIVAREAIAQNCKRPCFVGIQNKSLGNLDARRRNGFVKTLEANDIRCDEYTFNVAMSEIRTAELKAQILENGNDFIFCFNDVMAISIAELFFDEPKFRSKIFGVDGVSEYLSYAKKINSVGGDIKSLSKAGCHILLNRITNDDKQVVRRVFPVKLVPAEN